MEPLLRHQSDIGNQNPMPTDRVDETSVVATSTSETVAWLYSNSGVWASATGQDAGTIVTYKTTYSGIQNSVNATVGHSQDTSLSFAAATRAAQIVNVPESVFSMIQSFSPANQVIEMTKWLGTAGDYAIDHRRGQLWCNSKATVADDSITYDYQTPLSGGGTGDKVDVIKVGAVAVPTAGADAVSNTRSDVPTSSRISGFNGTTWDRLRSGVKTLAATLTGYLNTLPFAVYNAAPTTRTEGQGGPLQADASGNLKVNNVGSGGSAGGGNNTYSTEQGDFTATPTDSTFSIVLSVDSIGGQAITAANLANGILKIMDVSLTPDEFKTVSLDKFTWTAATKTIDITNCTGAFTLGTGDVISLTLTGPDKMRDSATDAQRTSQIRDLSDQYVNDTFTLTNVPNATPDETILISMDGYRGLSLHIEKTGGTDTFAATVEGTNEDVLSTADWLDITQYGMGNACGADAASYTADTILYLQDKLNLKGLKLKITTAGGSNDADFQVFVKRYF